jgi:putative transposase
MYYHKTTSRGESFSLLLTPFLQAPGLPFAGVLSEGQIEKAFADESVCFGKSQRSVYSPAITLWAFLSQVLHTGELRSCTAAVARVIVLLVSLEREPCSADSGAYCRARAKLPEKVIRRLAVDVGNQLESSVPADWLWHGRHVKLVDGTIVTMPDTPANQEAYPQQKGQKPGLGFPLVRMVVLLSLATAAACGVAFGPYVGISASPARSRRSLRRGTS